MTKPYAIIGLLAIFGTVLGVLAALVGLPYGRANYDAFAGPIHSGTPAPGAHLAIDCDVFTGGVQDACYVPSAQPMFEVDAVFSDTALAGDIGSFKVTIRNPGTNFTAPAVASSFGRDGNPDFNEAGPGAGAPGIAPFCRPPMTIRQQ